jgi:DNA-binding transcriptional LysR family regulator
MYATEDLTTFLVVAEELSLNKAAQRLRLATPSVSQRIRRLEAACGAELLNRSPRGVTLTAAGREMLQFAERNADLWARTVERLGGGTNQPAARIRLGAVHLGFRGLLEALTEALPGTEVVPARFTGRDDLLQACRGGQIEVGIIPLLEERAGSTALDLDGLELITVHRQHAWVSLGATHPLAGQDTVALSDLEQYEWIHSYTEEDADSLTRVIIALAGYAPRFTKQRYATHDDAIASRRVSTVIDLCNPRFFPVDGIVCRPLDLAPVLRHVVVWPRDGTLRQEIRTLVAVLRRLHVTKMREWNPDHWKHMLRNATEYPELSSQLRDSR